MDTRTLGRTGLSVTPLGLGAAEIGFLDVSQNDCDRLLNGILDLGINLVDTASCYAHSEEKIGRSISSRRDEFVVVTKCGHSGNGGGPPEWTPEVIRFSAERSLRRLQTDHLDILLLHSCPEDRLEEAELIEALQKCKDDGLTRFIGYSGDGEALGRAIGMEALDCVETSVSICDQQVIDMYLPKAREGEKGILAKRPLANTCWRDMEQYSGMYGSYAEAYLQRLEKLGFSPESLGCYCDWIEMALRFTVFQPGVDSALVGGTSLAHVEENIHFINNGPLAEEVVQMIRDAWKEHDDGSWTGET
ncbi:aldo/keto reductase [bacterium]|nr:aldo/keto reductase [bacterium]